MLSLQANQATPEAIKTAYLYNFTKFMQLDEKEKEVSICLYRQPAIIPSLEKLRGKKVRNRVIRVHILSDLEQIPQCTILMIPKLPSPQFEKILQLAQKRHILLVSDGIEQARAGIPLSFYIENGKLRFAVNLKALKAAKIYLSSKLLRMATLVH